MLRPRFIVADEPVSALDVSVGAQIVNLLKQLSASFAYLPVHLALHADRALFGGPYRGDAAGRVGRGGDTEQIINAPQHPYTRTLLEATPEIEVQLR